MEQTVAYSLKSCSVVFIRNIISNTEGNFIIGEKCSEIDHLFHEPLESAIFNTFSVNNRSSLRFWPCNKIKFKLYVLPMTENQQFAVFTLHSQGVETNEKRPSLEVSVVSCERQ